MVGLVRCPFIALAVLILSSAAGCASAAVVGANVPNTLDGGDGFLTTGGGAIHAGGSQTALLDSLTEAHNWTFEGEAGQAITVRVIGHPTPIHPLSDILDTANWSWQGRLPVYHPPARPVTSDPRVKLLDPRGIVVAEDDDSGGGLGGWDSRLAATLRGSGTYTLRVDVFIIGTYTIDFQTE